MPYTKLRLAYNRAYRQTEEGKAAHLRGKRRWRATPRGDYSGHKYRAARRGIGFLLTFEQWWAVWKPNWSSSKDDSYHMCRTGDRGPYAVGNVRIDTREANRAEQILRRDTKSGRFLSPGQPLEYVTDTLYGEL